MLIQDEDKQEDRDKQGNICVSFLRSLPRISLLSEVLTPKTADLTQRRDALCLLSSFDCSDCSSLTPVIHLFQNGQLKKVLCIICKQRNQLYIMRVKGCCTMSKFTDLLSHRGNLIHLSSANEWLMELNWWWGYLWFIYYSIAIINIQIKLLKYGALFCGFVLQKEPYWVICQDYLLLLVNNTLINYYLSCF